MRTRTLVIGLAALLGACSGRDKADAPAVVALPGPPVPAAPPVDTSVGLPERVLAARREMSAQYAVAGVAAIGADMRMLGTIYAPDVVLQMADSTYQGATAAIGEMVSFAKRNSMSFMTRTSVATAFLRDSVVSDSGTYTIVSKRAGADSVVGRGTYASTWRIRPLGTSWQLRTDRLVPRRAGRARGGATS